MVVAHALPAQLLGSQQVARYWHLIADSIKESMDSRLVNPTVIARYMGAIMNGDFQCWAMLATSDDSGGPIYLGCVITQVQPVPFVGRKSLVVCHCQAYARMALEAWQDVWVSIEDFARQNECGMIVAHSSNPRIIEVTKRLGFSDDWKILQKEIC